MKKPPTTLQDVQRALEEQDSQLQAAYRALTNHNGDPPIALPASAIERLDEACAARPRPSSAPKPTSGIRC